MTQIQNLKEVISLEYEDINTFLQKVTLPICLKKFLWLKKLKKTIPWTNVINDLNGEEIVGTFYEKDLQKQINKNLELKK